MDRVGAVLIELLFNPVVEPRVSAVSFLLVLAVSLIYCIKTDDER